MSTSRTSSTPASSSSLRPRAPRLISGLSDIDNGQSIPHTIPYQNGVRQASRSGSPAYQRPGSVTSQRLETSHSSRPTSRTRQANGEANVSLSKLWGTSWTAIQGLASDFLGEQEPNHTPKGRPRRESTSKPYRISTKGAQTSWGPSIPRSTPINSIASGSREERDALLRAQKRKDLLSGAAASYPDSLGKFKRRTSDEGISSSAPPGGSEDRDALVYLHHVQPADTLAGITIRYGCSASVLQRANRMWIHDPVQARKTLMLPVDACSVKGRPFPPHEADLLLAEATSTIEDTTDMPTPRMNGTPSHDRNESITSSVSSKASTSLRSSNNDTDPPWTHDSWTLLPNHTSPTEIARLPRRALGYFPPARRKSQSYSDLDTPSASLDLNRQAYFDSLATHGPGGPALSPLRTGPPSLDPQRPRRSRRTSNAQGYFPSYLTGPGGVGTMSPNVRSPGPAQDGLNRVFASRLPNVAPPPNQDRLYLPDLPVYSDLSQEGGTSSSFAPGSGVVSGVLTPTGGVGAGLENVGAAVEGWIRKMASGAQRVLEGSESPIVKGQSSIGLGGPSGVGDLIEMADSFEIGGDDEEEERGRSTVESGSGSGFEGGGKARSRGKSGKVD